nr:DNA-directed RNA polymerases IV and V subunit 2-like [Ipomoea batatas]
MERVSGIVANLRRTNPLQMTADMRKTRQQVSYTGKVGDARYPHPSHWGKVCFLSTPDGENCGLVKNLASLGLVSTNILESFLDKLFDCGMEKLVDDSSTILHQKHKIFLDGDWLGVCGDSGIFVLKLRRMRRRGEVPYQVEIKRDEQHQEVRIFSDARRILRPLLVVEKLKKIQFLKDGDSFQSFLDNVIVEFIGSEEEEDCQTAWGVNYLLEACKEDPPAKYTHCELDLSFLMGLSCGIIPFANHDHARRVLYQSEKHSQQAIGFSTLNPNIRIDTNTHQLYYPQRPLFRTILLDCLGKPKDPHYHKSMLPHPEYYNGQCAIVAVNVHLGYNQEDSLVMNRASLERGMFRLGFTRWGNERVYNGQTGEMINSLVFMGPTFYQRLTHMAEDKVKFRNTGPVHPLTRQPVADRKRFGGIKFGEMERDCLIAHGAAANLHERLFTLSDSSQMHICRKCKNMANVIQRPVLGGRKVRGPYCRFCESVEDIVKVNVPYGAKLLCQELFSMGLSLKFDTEIS